MRIETNLSEKPASFTVVREGDAAIITFYTDVQEVQSSGGDLSYNVTAWTILRSWTTGLAGRIEANQDKWFALVQAECYTQAASEVRETRDALLAESDCEMALDRMGLEMPSGTTFSSWLSFLKTLGTAISGDMAVYRQALRDITAQEGFPYDVDWPDRP